MIMNIWSKNSCVAQKAYNPLIGSLIDLQNCTQVDQSIHAKLDLPKCHLEFKI